MSADRVYSLEVAASLRVISDNIMQFIAESSRFRVVIQCVIGTTCCTPVHSGPRPLDLVSLPTIARLWIASCLPRPRQRLRHHCPGFDVRGLFQSSMFLSSVFPSPQDWDWGSTPATFILLVSGRQG
jgi:hypothetical protein